jgi:hypothetical protein
MKKCPKCGISLIDDAMFCNNCGENLSNPSSTEKEAPNDNFTNSVLEKAKKQSSASMVGKLTVVGAAVVLLLLIMLISGIANGGYKGAIKKYMKSVQTGNMGTMLSLSIPSKILDSYIEQMTSDGTTKKDVVKAYNNVYSEFLKALKKEQGSLKIKYEIKNAENLDKLDDLKEDTWYEDTDDFADQMEDEYEGFDADKVSKAYAVQVKYDVKAGKEEITDGKSVWIVYKYSGKWYIETSFSLESIIGACMYDDKFESSTEAYFNAISEIDF